MVAVFHIDAVLQHILLGDPARQPYRHSIRRPVHDRAGFVCAICRHCRKHRGHVQHQAASVGRDFLELVNDHCIVPWPHLRSTRDYTCWLAVGILQWERLHARSVGSGASSEREPAQRRTGPKDPATTSDVGHG